MGSHNKNPYRAGSAYAGIFDDVRKAGQKGVTRQSLIDKGYSAYDVGVVLSPRAVGESRGNPAGNFSAQGEKYFMQTRKVAGQPKVFVLRWRKTVLEAHVRPTSKKEVKAEKTAKAPAKAVAEATA